MATNRPASLLLSIFATILMAALTVAVAPNPADSPQDRTPTINPIHELNLYTLNKFPISVDTVKNCGTDADAETRIYCALKEAVPGLLDQSKGAVNVKVRIGSADLQTISRTPKPLHPAKASSTAETYAFDSDGEAYNAIFLDQGSLNVFAGEASADVAIALVRHLMDESYTFSLNSQCIIRTAANSKAIAFKNCQVLNAQKSALGKLDFQKIQCEKPAKTSIIGLSSALNGQCPTIVPGTGTNEPTTQTLSSARGLEFAEKETLPTINEYIGQYLPGSVFVPGSRNTPGTDPCLSSNPDDDANGFFGYRERTQVPGCVHFGIDLRGMKNSLAGKQVKAMLSGNIVRVKAHYQDTTSKDCVIVVKSGDWLVSYGHVSMDNYCAASRVGQKVKKGQTIATISKDISPSNGNELDIKVAYSGSNAQLNELTIKRLNQKDTKYPKYSKYFERYKTRAIIQVADFTFEQPNYDDYFLWEAYTTSLKPLTAVDAESTTTTTTPPLTTPTTTTTTPATDGKPLPDVCVYYYIDSKDGAKDTFFDAGIAAYAGPGGACLVGRASLARTDIQYPGGYSGYVNVNELPAADSYEGCYVAKIPLQKHGDQLPAGVNVKLFLSKSQAAFSGGEGYLEKGIPRSLADEKTIGKLSCQPPGSVKLKPADTAAAGRQFLQYAMELSGASYTQEGWRYQTPKKGIDCAGVVTYAFGRMLENGYRLPPEFYAEMKKTKFTTKSGTTVNHPVKGISGNAGYLSKIQFTDIKVPKEVDVPYPYLSDVWGGLLEAGGWEIPIEQAQPGDLAVWSFTDGGQCKGGFSEANPWQPVTDFCWRGEGHIEVVHSLTGNKITTFGSGSTNPPIPARVKPDRTGIYKTFRIPWIAPGGTSPSGRTQVAAGGCTDAGLAANLAQYGLKIETSIDGRSTMRDLNDWKPKIAAYSQKHYGDNEWRMTPTLIVQHYTVSSSFAWNLVTSATLAGEAPGESCHFQVDGNQIYQTLPINVRSRCVFGANQKSINIEMVALDAEDLSKRTQTLDTNAKLTAALMAQCNIPLEKVYSHQSFNDGKKSNPEYDDRTYTDYGSERKSDPGENNMKTIKDKIQAMGTLSPAGPASAQYSADDITLYDTETCVQAAKKQCPSTGNANAPNGYSVAKAEPECVARVAAEVARIQYSFVRAIMSRESAGDTRNYNQMSTSSSGAVGYMQMLPGTAGEMGLKPAHYYDAYYNICGGTKYLAKQLQAKKTLPCAAAAYNAGPGNVRSTDPATCVPNIGQTQDYVRSVQKNMQVA